ncbi:MAG: phosphorylase family protein [Desulfobacca sp.]|uniref:phosphorylase family protein n=1 Tax=Desulfobacca sp. TaxID=2067990 RepID=UPI004049BBB3
MSRLKVLILASSPEELRPFVRTCRRRRWVAGWRRGWYLEGVEFQGPALLLGMGGIGPEFLAAQALEQYAPEVIVVAGFGGALTAAPPPTSLVVAEACWRLTPDGCRLQPQEFPAAVPMVADLVMQLRHQGLPATAGNLITTARITAKASLLPLVAQMTAPVLDLETAAIAAVAQTRGLPLVALRAITDGAGEDIQDFLARIIHRHRGVPLSRLLPALLAHPSRLRYILHLWGRSRQAALHLAAGLTQILHYLAALRGAALEVETGRLTSC